MSTPKRWLFHGILSDTPLSEEDEHLRAEEIITLFKRGALYPGLRVTTLRLTPLPERRKKQPSKAEKSVENEPKSGPNAPWNKT